MASGFRAKGGGGGGGGGVLAGDVAGPLLANVIQPGVVTGGGGGMLAANTVTQDNLSVDAMPFNNLLTNPGFNISQLYDPSAPAPIADNAISADAWKVTWENAGVNYQRGDNANSAYKSASRGIFTKTTAIGKFMVYQPLESFITKALQNQTIVFSMLFNMAALTNMRIGFFKYTGATPNEVVPAPIAAWGANGVAPTFNAGFTVLSSLPLAVPAGFSNFDAVLGSGNFGDNDVLCVYVETDDQFAIGQILNLTECVLDKGSGGRFLFRPYLEEQDIAACQRFIEKSYDLDTVPGTVTTNGRLDRAMSTLTIGFSSGGVEIQRKVRVPTVAEITLFSPASGAAANWFNGNSAIDYAVLPAGIGDKGFAVLGGAAAGDAAQGHYLVNTSL
jgi:hypothetical protein